MRFFEHLVDAWPSHFWGCCSTAPFTGWSSGFCRTGCLGNIARRRESSRSWRVIDSCIFGRVGFPDQYERSAPYPRIGSNPSRVALLRVTCLHGCAQGNLCRGKKHMMRPFCGYVTTHLIDLRIKCSTHSVSTLFLLFNYAGGRFTWGACPDPSSSVFLLRGQFNVRVNLCRGGKPWEGGCAWKTDFGVFSVILATL